MRKLLLVLCLLVAAPAFSDVAESYTCATCTVDSADANVTTLSLTTFTVDTGSNLCLIGILHNRVAITSPTMTWNGVSMTQIGSGIQGTNSGVRLFYLVAPATGNQTLVASWTTGSVSTLGAVAFSGADQTTCHDAATIETATDTSGTPSTGAVTSATDAATVGAVTNAGNTLTLATQTAIYTDNSMSFQEAAASYGIGGTSNSHNWTSASTTWAAMGVQIKAAAAAASGGGVIGGGVCRGGVC